MQKISVEGIATITERGFHFDSGVPSDEPLLDAPLKLRGVMNVSTNGCADLTNRGRVILPPVVDKVAEGDGYRIKRTSRNYIIQLKVPIVEPRTTTENTLKNLVPVIMGDITLDRREVLGEAIR